MKKICFLLALLALLLCSCFSNNSELPITQAPQAETTPEETTPDQLPHRHLFENATVTKQPTCVEGGEAVAACSCGEIEKTAIAATGLHFYLNAECMTCGERPISLYSIPSAYDADGDGKTDTYNLSPRLLDGYQKGVHVWAGDYDQALSSPSRSSQNGYEHWYVTEYTDQCLVYRVNVPETGTYEMILHIRLKDAQERGTKYTINGGTDNEQVFQASYGYDGMAYEEMRNGTHGAYLYGITVRLVAGENTVKIEHAAASPKSQHYRDLYFVKVGEYHTHVYVEGICSECGNAYIPAGIAEYRFLYDTPGFAGGTLTFVPETTDVYTFYWADANGKLKDYSMLYSDEFFAGVETEITIQSFTAIPKGATRLIAVSGDKEITYSYSIPTSRLFAEEELYVFGALSDTHQGTRYGSEDIPYNHFVNAAKTLYQKGAIAIGICGDFSYNNTESEYILHANAIKEIYKDAPDMPIFTTTGNHESKFTGFSYEWYMQYARNVVDYNSSLDYTNLGKDDLDYAVELPDGSVMLFLHQKYYDYGKSTSRLLDDDQLDWLGARLEEYKERTVFLFFHTFMDEQVGDATSANNEYGLPMISSSVEYQKFDAYFKKYQNVVFFSGHSHWAFDSQLVTPKPGKTNHDKNIDNKNGTYATMVHIPACSTPRVLVGSGEGRSEGYIVRVYNDFIVLEGYEFAKGETFAYATFIIEK